LFSLSQTPESKPGSGNAISFNGSTQSVNIPNAASINFGTNNFSIAFWYNSGNNNRAELILEKRDDNCGDGQNWSVRKFADQIYIEINVPGPTSDVVTVPNAADGKWHHIVFTRTATQLSGFKDGVLIATTNAPAQNVDNIAALQIATGPCSPFFPGGNGFFTGSLDEIQFWNTALTQAQIRDRMCHKITAADPLYNNLKAYYNFDETSGGTVFDGTVNANNGTFVNSPVRVTSGAHIGNVSTHSYAGGTSTAVLNHPTRGDALTATLNSGGADGVQVYCVTEDPNNTTGQTILSDNNSYFGVFPINGTGTQYTATYNYTGIGLNSNPENKLMLYKRNDNAATTWTKLGAVLDSTANTFTATGQNTEYMIGLNDQQQALKPGSGNAISFDGVTQSVSIPNSAASNFGTGNFSVEFWLNSTGTTRDEILISKRDDGCGDGQLWGLYKTPAGTVYLEMHNPGNINQRISITNVLDGKWHHLSFVRNGTQLLGYKDGIQVDNNSATPINVNNSAALSIGTGACAPFITGGGLFEGKVDEFKIWNIALTQSEIRNRMCHKITNDDPLYSNLEAYYNFDETSGTTVFDGTVNANNGTLANNPTRVTSGAPIGNASSHDYVNATKTTSLAHASGESFTVTSASGNPDGIQLYRVDEQPNTTSGINTLGASDKYFGVFQINGTAPQYTGVYNYTGNAAVTGVTEPQLRLNKRTDNAAGSWSVLSILPNQTANTISVSGESTEYILGVSGSPLPLNLIYFNGSVQNGNTQLSWKTNNEINTLHFEVENSNGATAFSTIAVVQAQQLSSGSDYGTVHTNPFINGAVQYYRLKIIDKNGRFTYSNIIRLSNSSGGTDLSIFPNPAAESISISSNKKQEAVLTNSAGQLITKIVLLKGSQTINISKLAAGIYFIKGETVTVKFIKQ
jgi:hypothetical protein